VLLHRGSFAVSSLRAGYPDCYDIRARVAAIARPDPPTASFPRQTPRVAGGKDSPYSPPSRGNAQDHLSR